ncbi:C-myc promoter-binding protein isoform X1 [Lates japonicus]|uniref:C-myc promoter-binding protein isoform X1 n=1 Tax=Lates japonicus TaxID=270547 RepID=A0AAD3MS57_LATJO|nr:C-myc promoter-binding protein isoform X1 [Lates japonicus]
MEDKGPRVADYFVVAGLTDSACPWRKSSTLTTCRVPSSETQSPHHRRVAVGDPALGEEGYPRLHNFVWKAPLGLQQKQWS